MFSHRVIRMSITLAVIIGIALPAMVQQVPAAERKPKTQERKSGKKGTPSKRKVRKKGVEKLGKKGVEKLEKKGAKKLGKKGAKKLGKKGAKKLGKKGVEVRIGPKIKPFRTLGAAFTDLLKSRLQGGKLEGVTITPNEVTIAGLKPQLRNFHERVINHRFVDIPTRIELLEIESFLAPFQDEFRIDPQVLYDNSWESIQASMEDMKNLALSQAGGILPAVWGAGAAVVIAGAAAAQAANQFYKDYYRDVDGDGVPDSQDPEPKNPDVPKKQEKEETENITAESEAGAMMLVDTNAFELMLYDLLRQYKIQYRHMKVH